MEELAETTEQAAPQAAPPDPPSERGNPYVMHPKRGEPPTAENTPGLVMATMPINFYIVAEKSPWHGMVVEDRPSLHVVTAGGKTTVSPFRIGDLLKNGYGHVLTGEESADELLAMVDRHLDSEDLLRAQIQWRGLCACGLPRTSERIFERSRNCVWCGAIVTPIATVQQYLRL